jgi:uracil-DNA glycosylase family 4
MHNEALNVGIATEWMPNSLPPSPTTPAVAFVGQNPGSNEDRTRRNFVATRRSAGAILRTVYIDGIALRKRASVYLANAAKCGPRSTTAVGVYNACAPYLKTDLSMIVDAHKNAKTAAVFVSAPAVRAFFKLLTGEKMSQKDSLHHQGRILDLGSLYVARPLYFFSSYHPMYLNRGRKGEFILAVRDHMDLVSRFLDDRLVEPLPLVVAPPAAPSEGIEHGRTSPDTPTV